MSKKTIGECAKLIRGVSYKKQDAIQSPKEGYIPILRANNIVDNQLVWDELIYVPREYVNNSQYVRAGDVIITMSSGSKTHVGKVALANKDYSAAFGAFCGKLVCEKINPKYLTFALQSRTFRQYIESASKGTNINNLKQSHILSYEIEVPQNCEQERIVSRIEELFSKLDASVAELQTAKEKLKVYRQAVLKEAFNEHFKCYKLEDLCFFITKGTTPSKKELSSIGEIPFVKVYNLTFNTILDFSIEPTYISRAVHTGQLARSIVLPGDVLMNIVGPPMGKVSIVPNTFPEWNINQAIVRFRCKSSLNNKYLAHYLCYAQTVEKMKLKSKATAGQFNLTLEICRNVEIPVPPVEKQLQIVSAIESQLSICDSIEQTIDTSLQQGEALRQSILKQAFEGRI